MSELRNGTIQSFDVVRNFGTIYSDRERFWFHRDRIDFGTLTPAIGAPVTFEIGPKPPLPGKLRVAIRITVKDTPSVADLLSDKSDEAVQGE